MPKFVIKFNYSSASFKEVRVHQLLSQPQLRDVVALAKSLENVYRPPGVVAMDSIDV